MLENIARSGQRHSPNILSQKTIPDPTSRKSASAWKIKVQTPRTDDLLGARFQARLEHVTWRVAQSPPGSWMEGDRIFIERKNSRVMIPAFSERAIRHLLSGAWTWKWRATAECARWISPLSVFWHYKATLFNKECRTEDNPDGKVASWDPVVIIKPRP